MMLSPNITTNVSNNSSIQNNMSCDSSGISYPATYSVILFSIASSIGNVLIIMIVYRREDLRKTINYFIVNMAVSDFLFSLMAASVALLSIAVNSWQKPFGKNAGIMVCVVKLFLEGVSLTVSAQSLVWIALDRFVAVVFPMKVHRITSKFRCFAIASTWVVATLGNSFHFYSNRFFDENRKIVCAHFSNSTGSYLYYAKVYTALFQIVPFLAVTTLYSVITVTLKRQDKVIDSTKIYQRNHRKQRAIRMTFCIVAAFYICSLPFLVAALIFEYQIPASCSILKVLWSVASLMICVSLTVNPIICITFIQSYRNGLKEILRPCWSQRLRARKMDNKEQATEIALQRLRTIPGVEDNLTLQRV